MSRLRTLIDIARHRPLTDAEKAELQKLFVGMARREVALVNDASASDSIQ